MLYCLAICCDFLDVGSFLLSRPSQSSLSSFLNSCAHAHSVFGVHVCPKLARRPGAQQGAKHWSTTRRHLAGYVVVHVHAHLTL